MYIDVKLGKLSTVHLLGAGGGYVLLRLAAPVRGGGGAAEAGHTLPEPLLRLDRVVLQQQQPPRQVPHLQPRRSRVKISVSKLRIPKRR